MHNVPRNRVLIGQGRRRVDTGRGRIPDNQIFYSTQSSSGPNVRAGQVEGSRRRAEMGSKGSGGRQPGSSGICHSGGRRRRRTCHPPGGRRRCHRCRPSGGRRRCHRCRPSGGRRRCHRCHPSGGRRRRCRCRPFQEDGKNAAGDSEKSVPRNQRGHLHHPAG